MSREEHLAESPPGLSVAILTVSDSRDEVRDRGGATIRSIASEEGWAIAGYRIVADEIDEIREAAVFFLGEDGVDALIVTGGTGFSPRDRSVEAIEPIIDKQVDGFGELFRMLSWNQVGAAAMLSRALAGVVGERAVFVLPGSPKAVELAMNELVVPELGHLLGQVRKGAGR